MKKILIASIFVVVASACEPRKQTEEAPSGEAKTSYGKAYQSSKRVQAAQEERDKALDDQAKSLSDE